jgi:hypothetical protein
MSRFFVAHLISATQASTSGNGGEMEAERSMVDGQLNGEPANILSNP